MSVPPWYIDRVYVDRCIARRKATCTEPEAWEVITEDGRHSFATKDAALAFWRSIATQQCTRCFAKVGSITRVTQRGPADPVTGEVEVEEWCALCWYRQPR